MRRFLKHQMPFMYVGVTIGAFFAMLLSGEESLEEAFWASRWSFLVSFVALALWISPYLIPERKQPHED